MPRSALFLGYGLFSIVLLLVSFYIYGWAGLVPAAVVVLLIFTSSEFSKEKRIPNQYMMHRSELLPPMPGKRKHADEPLLEKEIYRNMRQAEIEFSETKTGIPSTLVYTLTFLLLFLMVASGRYPVLFVPVLSAIILEVLILCALIWIQKRKIEARCHEKLSILIPGEQITKRMNRILKERPAFDLQLFCSYWQKEEDARVALQLCDLLVEVFQYPGNTLFYPEDSFLFLRHNRGRRLRDAQLTAWIESRFEIELSDEDRTRLDEGSLQDAVREIQRIQTRTT